MPKSRHDARAPRTRSSPRSRGTSAAAAQGPFPLPASRGDAAEDGAGARGDTTAAARPFTTTVPRKAHIPLVAGRRFGSVMGATVFCAGSDSPVSMDSSVLSSSAFTSRMSAGTLTPEASSTTSPGTRSALSISCSLPSRTTPRLRDDEPLERPDALLGAVFLERNDRGVQCHDCQDDA